MYILSYDTWCLYLKILFRFEVAVKFAIPSITIEPALDTVQTAIDAVARNIMTVVKGITNLIIL